MNFLQFYIITVLLLTGCSVNGQSKQEISFWSYNSGFINKPHGVKAGYSLEIYDTNNLLIETGRYSNYDTKPYFKTVYTYNEKGQKISESEFYSERSDGYVRFYKYGESGLLQNMHFAQRRKEGYTVDVNDFYYYNDKNQLIRKERFCSDSIGREKWIYKYEQKMDNQVTTELHYYGNNKKPQKLVTIINKHGLIISTRQKGSLVDYEYLYNEKGEWIVKKVCERGSKISVWMCNGEFRRTFE